MRLPRYVYDDIIDHVLTEVPREACGLVAIDSQYALLTHVYRCANVAVDPTTTYRICADDQRFAMDDMEKRGWDLAAIYHSHPAGRACLSMPDLEAAAPGGWALYPGIVHLVIGVSDIIRPGMLYCHEHRLAVQGTRLEQFGGGSSTGIIRLDSEPLEVWS